MFFLIAIVGGLLFMMGQHTRSESLFYYFRLEDQVPENHLLRLIDRHISFDFVHDVLRDSYSETGRPSIVRSNCWVRSFLRARPRQVNGLSRYPFGPAASLRAGTDALKRVREGSYDAYAPCSGVEWIGT